MHKTPALKNNVNFCKNHRDKTEVPYPLAVEDLINYKLNNRRLLFKTEDHFRLQAQFQNVLIFHFR